MKAIFIGMEVIGSLRYAFRRMNQDSTKAGFSGVGWPRWAISLVCACGSGWMYAVVVRLTPWMASARPTAVGEVLPWVREMTLRTILGIQHRKEGFEYGLQHGVEFIVCCAGLFVLYATMLWVARGARSGWFALWVSVAPAIFMGMLLRAPAMFSSDVYAYAFYGRVLGVYGANAHAAAPARALRDMFLCAGWKNWGPSRYGPLWTAISAGVTWAGGAHVGLTLLIFRVLGAVAALACGALIWAIMKRLRPEQAAMGTVLFLWNPLVLIESAQSGHNDAFMMALALLAVWLHLRGRAVGAVAGLTLSALVKVISGPLVLLYILMIARGMSGWRERGWFVARAATCAAVVVAVTMAATRMSPSGLLVHAAASPGFYKNNYQELIFRGLRRILGEGANTMEAPMDFRIWWVATSDKAVLHQGLSNKAKDLVRLEPGHSLLALSEWESDEWLRVFDPRSRQVGYVEWKHLYVAAAPVNAESDPVVRSLSIVPADWPTVVTANQWIRVVSLGLFAGFGLLAAWKTRDLEGFLAWGTAFFLMSMLLVFSQIWPWYAVWPLAFGALKPGSLGTLLGVMLSAGLITLYAFLGYCDTRFGWAYDYRSIFTIVLPVVAFGLVKILSFLSTRQAGGRLES